MLRRFEVRNFKGFKEPLVLDLTARDYSFNAGLVREGIVNKGIIYGKNGTGKSNLGIALFDIVANLTDKQRMRPEYLENYINYDTPESYAVFKYEFKFEENVVRYEYAKIDSESFIYENFYIDDDALFEYDFENHNRIFVNERVKNRINFDSIVDNKLSIAKYISRGLPKNTIPEITRMIEFVEGMLWYRSLSDGNNYAGFTLGTSMLSEILYESGKIREFEAFLKDNEIEYKLQFRAENGRHQLYSVIKNGSAPFDSVSSTGTKALFLYFIWKLSFEGVSLLFIDEFDAFLHYEAAAMIIKQLNEDAGFQSFVTSHNTYLMQNKLTRPDACFILSDNKIKAVCNCTDKEIREAHNLEKMYINGAFND